MLWFETDFTGGAPDTVATIATEPIFDHTQGPGDCYYRTVPGVGQGVDFPISPSQVWGITGIDKTTWRAGWRVTFLGSTSTSTYHFMLLTRAGGPTGQIGWDIGLRNASGSRHVASRNNFAYIGEAAGNPMEVNETWSIEALYDEGALSVWVWDGLDTSIPSTYTWTSTANFDPPDMIQFGNAAGNTGVGMILSDFWMSDGERREDDEPIPVSHWAHNGSSRDDRFLVSARVENATSVSLEYSTNADYTGSSISEIAPVIDTDNYHLEAADLDPNTTYYWRVLVNGAPTLLTGKTKTLPEPNVPASMSILWGSCYWSNASAVFPYIVDRNPDLVIQVGDDGYTFHSAGETNPNPGQPYPAPADTALIRSIRDEVFTRAGRRTMTAAFPVEHMYSDCDGLGGNMDSTQAPAANVQEAWRQMYAHYLDDTDTGFRTFVVGRVRFIVVDENTASDAKNSPQSPSKSKLGATQKALLFDALDQATANKQLVFLFGDGPWLGATDNSLSNTGIGYGKYNDERTEIGEYVQECISNGMLGFHRYHGDDHTLYGDSGANNPWGGFPVYCAAPMNETSNTGTTATYDAGKWPTTSGEAGSTRQYGFIEVTDDGTDITVRTRGFSSTASEPTEVARYDQTLTYSQDISTNLLIGNSSVSDITVGSTVVDALYLGSEELWRRI